MIRTDPSSFGVHVAWRHDAASYAEVLTEITAVLERVVEDNPNWQLTADVHLAREDD